MEKVDPGSVPVQVPHGWSLEGSVAVGPFVTRAAFRGPDGTLREWTSRRHRKRSASRAGASAWWQPTATGWWIALLFALGSVCFAVGVVPAYVSAVGASTDAWTFFIGSLFFTSAGYLQFLQAINAPVDAMGALRGKRRLFAWQPHRIDWWACAVQLAGTLFFNVSTFAATRSALDPSQTHRIVWAPDLFGSIAFIVASWLAWVEVCHRWFAWRTEDVSWWIVAMNLGGSIAFLISAFAARTNPDTGEVANLPIANLGTFVGAVGFLVGALLLVPEMRATH
jgi:hypothetical protein